MPATRTATPEVTAMPATLTTYRVRAMLAQGVAGTYRVKATSEDSARERVLAYSEVVRVLNVTASVVI